MVFGITFPDLFRFFMQFSGAVAGAASFWGLILSLLAVSKKFKHQEKSESYFRLSSILMFVFSLSAIAFIILWLIGFTFVFTPFSMAHEGIKIDPTVESIKFGFMFNSVLVAVFTIFSVVSMYIWRFKYNKFRLWSPTFFSIQFILLSFIIAFVSFTGELFSRDQLFFFFHNWHSIFTVASVVVVDVLYITTIKKDDLKVVLYPFFPWISLAIWTGLGFDFLSVTLIFDEAFQVTSQFLFSQTVVSIIILNGLLLSERLNDLFIDLAKKGRTLILPKKLERIASISGAISIVSWVSITFVDFFELTINYATLVSLYILTIALFYSLEPILGKVLNATLTELSPNEK